MAVTFSNIITGEGKISLGPNTYGTSSDFSTAVDLGGTMNGVEIAWEPTMVEIEIDQFGDAARIITEKIKVTLKTSLAEATLENLSRSWNYISSNAISTTAGVSKTLAIGIQSVYPAENYIRVVGTAPNSTATKTYSRTYECWRAVQFSSSAHKLKRSEAVSFPVDFRILPNQSQTGKEYGTITDSLV
jgi:hypothetical protein